MVTSAKVLVAENAMNGAPLDQGFQSPLATKNILKIEVNQENGQINIYYSTRVAAAPNNVLALVPSSVASLDQATRRVSLKANQAVLGDISWECFAKDKQRSSLAAPSGGEPRRVQLPHFWEGSHHRIVVLDEKSE